VLDIENGGTVIAKEKLSVLKSGNVYVRSGASLDLREGAENMGRLEVAVNGHLKARDVGLINRGTISGEKGNGAPGKIEIQGNATQTDTGRLELRLASAASYDHLFVSPLVTEPGGGHVALDGRLSVQTSYTPTPWTFGGAPGDFFTVVRATNSLTGQFDPLTGLDLPDPSTLAPSLPPLPPGQAYAWRVIYDTTDSFDPSLASTNPAFANQPWAGNGTKDVVLLLEAVARPQDLVATAARPVGSASLAVDYRVVGQPVTSAFQVSVYASSNGLTPSEPADRGKEGSSSNHHHRTPLQLLLAGVR
jgi:hypothetical protein